MVGSENELVRGGVSHESYHAGIITRDTIRKGVGFPRRTKMPRPSILPSFTVCAGSDGTIKSVVAEIRQVTGFSRFLIVSRTTYPKVEIFHLV